LLSYLKNPTTNAITNIQKMKDPIEDVSHPWPAQLLHIHTVRLRLYTRLFGLNSHLPIELSALLSPITAPNIVRLARPVFDEPEL
jgi:hypothetical protein